MDALIQLSVFIASITLFVYFKYRKLSEIACIFACASAALSLTIILLPFVSWMNFNEGVGIISFFLIMMAIGFLLTFITEKLLKQITKN